MIPAGIGSPVIDHTSTARTVEIDAIVVGESHECEDPILEVEALYHSFLFQLLRQRFDRFLSFKGSNRTHSDQIRNLHFNRHGTAVCPTG